MRFSLSFICPSFNVSKYLSGASNTLALQELSNINVEIIFGFSSHQFRGCLGKNDKSKILFILKTGLNYNLKLFSQKLSHV